MPTERSVTVHLHADTSRFIRGMVQAHLGMCGLALRCWLNQLGRSGR